MYTLTLSQTIPGFYVSTVQVFWKQSGKRGNCSLQTISPFPTLFSLQVENILLFSSNLNLSSANSFTLEESKICCLGKGNYDWWISAKTIVAQTLLLGLPVSRALVSHWWTVHFNGGRETCKVVCDQSVSTPCATTGPGSGHSPTIRKICIICTCFPQLFTTQSWLLTTLREKTFENMVGKRESACNQHFFLYPQCFLPWQGQILSFGPTLICRLQMHSIWINVWMNEWMVF